MPKPLVVEIGIKFVPLSPENRAAWEFAMRILSGYLEKARLELEANGTEISIARGCHGSLPIKQVELHWKERMMSRIMQVSVLAALEEAAPKVMVPSYEGHKAVMKALVMWSSAQPVSGTDEQGKTYWIAALHELAPLTGMDIPAQHMGRACRSFCLVMKREDDGYRVAWSKQQLEILRKEFNMLGESK